MVSILKNPFFIAIAAAVAIGTAFGLLFAPNTNSLGQIFVLVGAFSLFAIVPTLLVAFIISGFMQHGARLAAEQATTPKSVLAERYMTQMLWSLGWTLVGVILTAITYLLAKNSGGGTFVICTGAIVFGILGFLGGLIGWLRNQ